MKAKTKTSAAKAAKTATKRKKRPTTTSADRPPRTIAIHLTIPQWRILVNPLVDELDELKYEKGSNAVVDDLIEELLDAANWARREGIAPKSEK